MKRPVGLEAHELKERLGEHFAAMLRPACTVFAYGAQQMRGIPLSGDERFWLAHAQAELRRLGAAHAALVHQAASPLAWALANRVEPGRRIA